MTVSPDKLENVLKQYREAAANTADPDPETANRWADKLHQYYKQLRATKEGREGITNLLSDPSPHVRIWAASHALFWVPTDARRVLEELRDAKGRRSFEAEIVLREFDAGKLSFDY